MLEVVRKLKINRRFAALPCSWCSDALNVGEDGAICEACESAHHARCWDTRRGCAQNMCVNAPLRDLDLRSPKIRETNSNVRACRFCKKAIQIGDDICRYCGEIVSADGLYHGEKKLAREARQALILGIIGFFLLGGVLGPVAFLKGRDAKKHIANNPKLRGREMALAAQIIGVADVAIALVVAAKFVQLLMK